MQVTTPEFEKAYKGLNPEQKKAVDMVEGPVMVVAGPGTGKTQVLTLRIANILLKTDTKPENILALTFTEAASSNMRKRLVNIIGERAYRVRIQTFHSFCNDILQTYPEYFPRIVGSKSITEVEASSIIEEIILSSELSILKPWGEPLLYVGDILRKIEELKREGLAPEAFSSLLQEIEKDYLERGDLKHEKGAYKGKMKASAIEYLRKIEKNKELVLVYSKYQEKLTEKKMYDFSDMILEVLKKLQEVESRKSKVEKEGDLKMVLQENHQYILVDEHQDTNTAQNKILEIICDFHQSPNIFVVGDSKQAIFRFQGASIENFLYFKKLYPEALIIELFRNYRSTQGILDSAHSLIPSEKKLESSFPLLLLGEGPSGARGGEVFIAGFENKNLENYWIAEEIKKKIKNRELAEVAIIYRSNREAFAMADSLRNAEVPYNIESDEDLLGDKFVQKFLSLVYAINYYGEDEHLAPALHVEELGLDILEAYKIIRQAKNSKKSIYEILPTAVSEKLQNWAKLTKEEDLVSSLQIIFRESGLMESMLKSRDGQAFLGIERLMDEAKRLSHHSLPEFIKYLETLKTHGLFIKRPKSMGQNGSVRLMTAHRAKGLEFETVFIINSSEKSFGHGSHRDKLPLILPGNADDSAESNQSDERRLFYVALTRAKKNLFITYHNHDEEGKEILPSPFIHEIKEELKSEVNTKEFEDKIKKDKSLFGGASSKNKKREIDKEFVSNLFFSQPFSVTALNNYLACPWKYFYRNLVRIPEFQEKYLLYGTAMHAAVEDMFKGQKEEGFLLQSFEKHITESVLSEAEMKESLKRGTRSLRAWYEARHNSWVLPYKVEQNIWGVKFEDVLLSGKLDKVEFVDSSEVFVTDYKTGKVKSRNEIMKGDMKRQLLFYKLLLDIWEEGKYNMTKGTIEFLEPNESGKIKFEEFLIEPGEVLELKETVRRVAHEITTLSFWDKYCDEKDCKYCAYRKLLG